MTHLKNVELSHDDQEVIASNKESQLASVHIKQLVYKSKQIREFDNRKTKLFKWTCLSAKQLFWRNKLKLFDLKECTL